MSDRMETQREFMQKVARGLDKAFNGDGPREVGFALLTYNFGQLTEGKVNYIGNGKREDVLVALKELIARWEGRYGPEGVEQ